MVDVKIVMSCPKCGKNNWKLEYNGDELGDGIEKITTIIGSYGYVLIECKCGFKHTVWIGSD